MPSMDGTWSWLYRGDGIELRSASNYRDSTEAQQAARVAYPRVPLTKIGSSMRARAKPSQRSMPVRRPSAVALVKVFLRQASSLIRDERDLARAEIRVAARRTGFAGGFLGTAILLGLLAAGSITACLIMVLATFMPAWLAALIVSVVLAIGGAVFGSLGIRSARRASPPMPQTAKTVKETLSWAKDQMRSGNGSRTNAES